MVKLIKYKKEMVIGLMAEECVFASLIDGQELGYNMYVIPQAIIGKSQKSKVKTISKLQKLGIKLIMIPNFN